MVGRYIGPEFKVKPIDVEAENRRITRRLFSRGLSAISGPRIVCLCGSVRFREQFDEWIEHFTERGWIYLAPGIWDHEPLHTPEGQEQKEALDELHLRKIDLADLVFVVNVDGYIGESTKREIDYARSKGKLIEYMEGGEK